MNIKKVYIVGGDQSYARFLGDVAVVERIEDSDIVLFTGGEDVNPSLYGCERHPSTYCSPYRDKNELEIYNKAINSPNVKLLIGVCRGSQFLCVANGGMLVQNVRNHATCGTHDIINDFGDVYPITSTHHQMQYPYNLPIDKYKILYWSYQNYSNIHEGDRIKWDQNTKEPEIVLYNTNNNIKSLAIQGHPEMMPSRCVTNRMINEIVDILLNSYTYTIK